MHVYSFHWPDNINIKEFANKIASQIDNVVKNPFCLVGFSFGVPICWRIAQKLEGSKNYKNIIISIDGTMLVDDVAKHMYNSLSGNPPRKLWMRATLNSFCHQQQAWISQCLLLSVRRL